MCHRRPTGFTLGFTLIELVIAIAIVAILATIALPSYQAYVRKARRSDAQAALLAIQLAEEKYRANNSNYADNTYYQANTAALGGPATGASVLNYYSFSITGGGASNPNVFSVTATATGGQANDQQSGTSCTPLSIDQTGNRSPAACW
jgi:type IV pilus assembly protein PilE